jgi:hypothetical protein
MMMGVREVDCENVNVLMRLLPLLPCTHNSTNKRREEKWKKIKLLLGFVSEVGRGKKTEKRIM